jgi:PAS domain S-box-containing protein
VVAVPLIKQGRWVSALGVFKPRAHPWSANEIATIEYTAERTWSAVVRARAEAALQEREERYRTLFESIDAGFALCEVIVDKAVDEAGDEEGGKVVDYLFLEVNPAYEKLVGLKSAEVIGRRAREIMPSVDERWINLAARVALQGERLRFEAESKLTGKWFDFFFSPTGRKGSGQFATVFNDITARKEAEQALRESDERKSFLLKLGDALRPLTEPLEIQAAATRLLGEHFGAHRAFYAEIEDGTNHFVISDDYVVNDYGVSDYEAESASLAGRHRMRDFGPTFAELLGSGQTMIVNDVAELAQKPREKAASAALGLVSGVAVPLIKQGRLVNALGVTKREAYQWRANEVWLIEETAERTWEAVERARAERALRRLNEELENRVAERTAQVSALVTQLTMSEHEERHRISSILHDDLQQRLFSILVQFQILREMFKGTVSGAASGSASGAGAGIDFAEREAALAQIEGEMQEVLQVTRELSVDFSPPILYDEGLVEMVQWLANRMKRQHGLEVKLTVERALPPLSENLRLLFFQVVRELLFNVVKHADVKQAEVILSHDQSGVRIEVNDEGKGFQSHEGDDIPTNGLGLRRIHQRLQLLGGDIKVISQPGKGTRIALYSPLQGNEEVAG